MLIRNGQEFNQYIPYGIGDDGTFYYGSCPDGVSGTNYASGTGPLMDESQYASFGITQVPNPVRLDDRFYFNTMNEDGSITSTPKSNEQVDDVITKMINIEHDRREVGGFTYLGKVFDSDERSVIRINVAVNAAIAASLAGQPFSIEWTCADNSKIVLDAQAMMGVPVAFALYADALHKQAANLKQQVREASFEGKLAMLDVIQADWSDTV